MKPIIECIQEHIMTFPELKDEPFQETDIIGCSPSISYAFDLHRNCEVQQDIVNITDNELIADDAVRNIVIVDIDEGTAIKRPYAVIPSTEGDNIQRLYLLGHVQVQGRKNLRNGYQQRQLADDHVYRKHRLDIRGFGSESG